MGGGKTANYLIKSGDLKVFLLAVCQLSVFLKRKKSMEWEQKEAKHDAIKQNALARVFKFIAEAEGNADDILNPAWIPQHTGLILTTAKTTGASLWVSKEGQQAFEERGWDAVQKN